jgi:hypothetical protein
MGERSVRILLSYNILASDALKWRGFDWEVCLCVGLSYTTKTVLKMVGFDRGGVLHSKYISFIFTSSATDGGNSLNLTNITDSELNVQFSLHSQDTKVISISGYLSFENVPSRSQVGNISLRLII